MYMDVNSRRRAMLLQMTNGSWKQKHISPSVTLSNALSVKEWIESMMPSGVTKAYVFNDDISTDEYENNQLVIMAFCNGDGLYYIRYRNSQYVTITFFLSNYDLVVGPNDQYTIFYQ